MPSIFKQLCYVNAGTSVFRYYNFVISSNNLERVLPTHSSLVRRLTFCQERVIEVKTKIDEGEMIRENGRAAHYSVYSNLSLYREYFEGGSVNCNNIVHACDQPAAIHCRTLRCLID